MILLIVITSSDHYVNLLTSVQTLFSYFPCKLFFFEYFYFANWPDGTNLR